MAAPAGAPPAAPPAGAPPAAANTISIPGIGVATQQADGTYLVTSGPAAGVKVGADGRVDSASLAFVQSVAKAQAQPGGLPPGSYMPNPDGTLTITNYGDVPAGTVVNQQGQFMNPDGTPFQTAGGGPLWATRQPNGAPASSNPNFKGDNGGLITNLVTKDNPIAGTINAVGDIASGQYKKAASDFGAGVSGGTLPQVDANGNVISGDTTTAAAGAAGAAAGDPLGGFLGTLSSALGGLSPSTTGLDKASTDAQTLEQQYIAKLNALKPGTAPQLDPTQQAQFRGAQLGLVGNLQDTIAGNTPSVAQIQQQQAFDQLRAQQAGQAAAAGRGGNSALAMRTAANNIGTLGAAQASASSLLRAQEQATARGQLGDVTNAGRSTDVNIAGANQTSDINTRSQDITQQNNLGNQALQANANDVNAQSAKINAKNQQLQQIGNLASTGLGVLSTLSDERAKTDIRPESTDEIRDFLAQITPAAYRYRGFAEPKVGVMAQDVERSGMGRTIVRETPAGKAIDIPSATGAMLAALADMHRRVATLESGGARR